MLQAFSAVVRGEKRKINLKAQLANNCKVPGSEALRKMPERSFST